MGYMWETGICCRKQGHPLSLHGYYDRWRKSFLTHIAQDVEKFIDEDLHDGFHDNNESHNYLKVYDSEDGGWTHYFPSYVNLLDLNLASQTRPCWWKDYEKTLHWQRMLIRSKRERLLVLLLLLLRNTNKGHPELIQLICETSSKGAVGTTGLSCSLTCYKFSC